MKRQTIALASAAALMLLSACGEKSQDMARGSSAKTDAAAYQGTGVAPFTAGNWKAGDRANWEQALKARAQGQNEYLRVQAK